MEIINLKDSTVVNHGKLPVVLTIAGSDSSGGAGIEADIKTLTAHKVYGLTCITALTAQNTTGVKSIHAIPKSMIKSILEANFDDFLYGNRDDAPLLVIKTGMLTQETVEILSDYMPTLQQRNVKLVLDPVMISTSGSQLFDEPGMKLCIDKIVKHSYIITPNFLEALVLLKIAHGGDYSVDDIKNVDDLINIVVKLQKTLGCRNVMVKGGHIPWNEKTGRPFQTADDIHDKVIIDILYQSDNDKVVIFQSKSIESENTHGTGCTLASSIAANLAKGVNLSDAIALSIDYIHGGLVNMPYKLGHGNGPINHLIEPTTRVEKILHTKDVSQEILHHHDSFLKFFKTHDNIKANWQTYTNHRFVNLLAQNKLPFNQFLYFLKQDYYYLINYAQIHGLAASTAPNYHQTHSESLIITEIVTEIEKHKEKLSNNYNIVYERDIDLDLELSPGKACLAYCNYLLDIGKREDFLGIKVALAPCLHGYYEAGKYGLNIRQHHDGNLNLLTSSSQSEVYDAWLQDYTSDWYTTAATNGEQALQDLLKTSTISQSRLDELVTIFNDVTKLEIAFWDEVLGLS